MLFRSRPTYVSARVVLGRAYLENGDHAKAEAEFHRVVELSPDNLRARIHLGEICAFQGRTNEAIRHYEAALEVAPLDREIRTRLLQLGGSFAFRILPLSVPGTKDVPEPSLESTGPDSSEVEGDPFTTETLADLYASQGFKDRAAAIYQRLLDDEPSRGEIREKLTALCEMQGGGRPPQDGSRADANP